MTGSPEADPPETRAPIVYDVVIMERAFEPVDAAPAADDDRARLVLNLRNPIVARMAEPPDPRLAELAVQALYGQAPPHGHHPPRPEDGALLNRSFLGLLDWAIGGGAMSAEGQR